MLIHGLLTNHEICVTKVWCISVDTAVSSNQSFWFLVHKHPVSVDIDSNITGTSHCMYHSAPQVFSSLIHTQIPTTLHTRPTAGYCKHCKHCYCTACLLMIISQQKTTVFIFWWLYLAKKKPHTNASSIPFHDSRSNRFKGYTIDLFILLYLKSTIHRSATSAASDRQTDRQLDR